MKINQAIKKLNEDYETLDRIDGDAVIDPTTAKAKKEAEEGRKNIEKVMKETTPEEIKDPKMPKTKDLKAMGLQESLNTLMEGYIEDTENHDFLVEYLDNYGDLNRLEVADNNAQSFFNELANMNLVNDFSKIILFEIDDATIYKDQDYDSIVDEYDFDEFTGEFTKKEESLNESSIINPMFNSAEEYSVAAKEWVENEGDFKASISNDNQLNILFPDDTLLGSIDMNELFKKVKEDIEWSFDSDDDVVDLGFGTSDETFWTDLFWEEYDKLVENAEENFEESLIDKDDDAFLSGGLVLSEDENDWEISSTDNLELFDDNEYNRKLAEVQMSNFGKVYYWVDTLEPLEVEEVFDYDLEESLNEDSGQRAVRYFNKQVNGKLDGIERPTLGDYIKALEEE